MTSPPLSVPFVPVRSQRRGVRSNVERLGKSSVILIGLTWAVSLLAGFEVGVAVLTLAGLVAAVAGLFRPALGFLGISLLCTLDALSRHFVATGGLFRWNTLNYWLLIASVIFAPLILRRRDWPTRLALGLAGVMFVQLAASDDLLLGVQALLNFAAFFGLLVYAKRSLRQPEVWYWMGIICGWTAALAGPVYFLQRSKLPTVTPNALAYLPITAIFAVCLSMPFAESRRRQWSLAALATVNFCWVFLTGSRGSILVASIAVVYLIFQLRGNAGRRFLVLGGSVLVSLLVLSCFSELQRHSVDRWQKLFDTERTLSNRTSGRSDLAKGAWQIFVDHPFGAGTGSFHTHWANLRSEEYQPRFGHGVDKAAHAGWLRTLAENGVAGMLLLLSFVISFAVIGWRMRRTDSQRLGLLVTCALGAAFLATEFQPKGLWFLAAAATVLLHDRAWPAAWRPNAASVSPNPGLAEPAGESPT